jgi:RNA polymerase-binding transcription factor DksA
MTPAELESFREQLVLLGKRLKGDASDLARESLRSVGGEASGSLSNTPVHMADLGSDAYEQEVALSLLETEEQRLEEVAQALERIERGTFGRCESCAREIRRERLRAVPLSRLCVVCARKMEGGQEPGNL